MVARHALFQPTRPLRGATGRAKWYTIPKSVFQPTRPLRGATKTKGGIKRRKKNFNPRAPCGARLTGLVHRLSTFNISTHAPLAGRDDRQKASQNLRNNFNPRAPCGARQQKCTNHYAHFCDNRQISDAFAQNAACQGILLLFDAGKPCGFWVRTAQVISARLCFAL